MMVADDCRVRVDASAAEVTEASLTARGLCNWLVDWSGVQNVYCGQPAKGELCNEHRGTFSVVGGEALI